MCIRRPFARKHAVQTLPRAASSRPRCKTRNGAMRALPPPQVEACKRNMNTFAYVGDLDSNPQINCVYHSEEAENQYLLNPKNLGVLGGAPPAPVQSNAAAAAAAAAAGEAKQ